ncbi:MAG TPA: hypothetical protein VNF04_01735, partial [Stellaceae bacterium]|nr:hypothetical protein [Stellaceae bacterium]
MDPDYLDPRNVENATFEPGALACRRKLPPDEALDVGGNQPPLIDMWNDTAGRQWFEVPKVAVNLELDDDKVVQTFQSATDPVPDLGFGLSGVRAKSWARNCADYVKKGPPPAKLRMLRYANREEILL